LAKISVIPSEVEESLAAIPEKNEMSRLALDMTKAR
jgi:hypothetical protein